MLASRARSWLNTDEEKCGLEPAVHHLNAQEPRFTYSGRSPRHDMVLCVVLGIITQRAFAVILPLIYHLKLGLRTIHLN